MGRTGHFDKSCLNSVVKNTSGQVMTFGFLPPHGVTLGIDDEYEVYGDVREAMVRNNRATDRRRHQALSASLDRGDLTIVYTPRPILQDDTTNVSKMLRLNSGSLAVADPCWNTSDSEDVDVPA